MSKVFCSIAVPRLCGPLKWKIRAAGSASIVACEPRVNLIVGVYCAHNIRSNFSQGLVLIRPIALVLFCLSKEGPRTEVDGCYAVH